MATKEGFGENTLCFKNVILHLKFSGDKKEIHNRACVTDMTCRNTQEKGPHVTALIGGGLVVRGCWVGDGSAQYRYHQGILAERQCWDVPVP